METAESTLGVLSASTVSIFFVLRVAMAFQGRGIAAMTRIVSLNLDTTSPGEALSLLVAEKNRIASKVGIQDRAFTAIS